MPKKRVSKQKTIKELNKKVAKKFKDILEEAAKLSGTGKVELLMQLGYKKNSAKQIVGSSDRNFPVCYAPEFCKLAGNNLIIEWLAEQVEMKLVPKNQEITASSDKEILLQNELDEYKKLVAELYRDLKKS